MPGSRKRRDRTERFAELIGDPVTFRTLCEFIVEGGSLPEWCKHHDVRYVDVAAWINAEDHRRKQFETARELRGEFLSEIVVRNLRMFAELDWGKAYDKNGNVLPVPDMPEDLRRALTSFEVTEEFQGRGEARESIGYTKKIRGVAPEKAVELLGKYRKMFVDKVEHSGKVTLEDLVAGSMQPDAPAT